MADKTTKEAKISIEVYVDKVKRRVVYAEADYSFVDILFSFMALPLGTIVRLLGKLDDKKYEPFQSLTNLYQSLKDIPECYLLIEDSKDLLLNPRSLSYNRCRNLKLKLDDTEPLRYYTCAGAYHTEVSTSSKAKCLYCGKLMDQEIRDSHSNINAGGVFVSEIAKFIVTDDLCVMPYTSASSVRLLTDHGISEASRLEVVKLDLDSQQMLLLLKAALSLHLPLTYLVFHKTESGVLNPRGLSNSFDQTDLIGKEPSSNSAKFFLEVSLQKSTGKLLYAEAKEDFVDFLFGLLSIPLGTVIGELLKGASSLTCMDNICKSIRNMISEGNPVGYLQSSYVKDELLAPHIGQHLLSRNQLFVLKALPVLGFCRTIKDPRSHGEGLLKKPGLFLVTDDLIITPSSSYSTLTTLSNLKVSFHDIKKYEISIGLTEGLKILKASLTSSSTLTTSLDHLLQEET